ncbi:WecB/TagA/CpsF family glycosyltransferase [Vibrio parahaemolyticus]|uniref:WecB/TagA/CpsF family glycosyltransferase n=1 Tax=Vibrio parahaemolyticus TaxID=670 RepID=UPI003B67E4CA
MQMTEISEIPVNCFSGMSEAVDYILKYGKGKTAVAINPEKILAAIRSPETRDALLKADIRYLDGIGAVKVAEKKLSAKLSRVPGCELWEELMKASSKEGKSVFLLGASSEVVNKTTAKLESKYGVNIVGFSDGFFESEDDKIKYIQTLKPDILTVAMGSPKQEIFMQKCRDAGIDAFMMGVGGTYNVFVGAADRAPKAWCNLNLEWLYRLLKEPSRIFRQVRLLKFLWLAITRKI